jgi:hypothetical protein
MAFIWRQKKEAGPCVHELQGPSAAPAESTGGNKTSPNHVAQADVNEVNTATSHEQSTVFPAGKDSKGRCTICRAEQLAARRYRIKLIIGLFCPFALQALDVTIVASALPWIASDFSKSCKLFLYIVDHSLLPRQNLSNELDHISFQSDFSMLHTYVGSNLRYLWTTCGD